MVYFEEGSETSSEENTHCPTSGFRGVVVNLRFKLIRGPDMLARLDLMSPSPIQFLTN